MTSTFGNLTLDIFQPFENVSGNASFQGMFPDYGETVSQNTSFQNGCVTVVFSEMEFLPWDNPDNIISVEVERVFSQIKNILLVLLVLISAPANTINMAVFIKQGLKDRVNLCLFALSFTDGFKMLNSVVHHGEQVHIQFTTKEKFGPISTILVNSNLVFLLNIHYISFVLSAIIATERCICVFNPLKFQRLLSTKTMAAIIIIVYILVLGLFFLASFRYRVGCIYDPVTDVTVMTGVEGEFYKAHKEFIDPLESFIFGIGIPGVVMLVVVITTTLTNVKLRQIVKWRTESSSSISASEVALTKTLVANSIFFIICLFPVAVIRFSWFFFPEINLGRRNSNFFLMTVWINEIFTYINCTFNFFVYYFMGSRYRETFWSLFGRKLEVENFKKSMIMSTKSR